MKKRFITRNTKKRLILKIVSFLIIIFFSLVITFNLLLKTSLRKKLGETGLHENLVSKGTNQANLFSLELLNPKDMFTLSLNYMMDIEIPKKEENIDLIKEHINDEMPRIYIYSTHDQEGYNSSLLESYNINYNVKIGSYILSEHLKDLGIPNYVEKASMADYLKENGLNYNYSYRASKYYIEMRKNEYPSIEYIIDFHRDSAPASVTKVEIDGVNYAKVMFVVGLDPSSYERSMALAEKMNSHIDSRMTRGILKRNGTYNQDLNENSLLIEVGGVDNTIEEVGNTTKVLAKVLFDIMNGEENG